MTDIVERMRAHITNRGGMSRDADGNPVAPNGAWAMMLEAANEIERIRKANDEASAHVMEAETTLKVVINTTRDADIEDFVRAYFEKHKEPAA